MAVFSSEYIHSTRSRIYRCSCNDRLSKTVHPRDMLTYSSDRPQVPRVLLSQLVCLSLGHAFDNIVVVTPQLLLVVLLEIEVHEGEDDQRIGKHREGACIERE